MFVLKLVAIWFLFSCIAAPLLGFAMRRAGRDGEVEELRRRYAAERRLIRTPERKRSEKEVLEPVGSMRHAG